MSGLFLLPRWAQAPKSLGVLDGQLAEMPDTPNAVSSQAASDHEGYMDPIDWTGTQAEAIAAIQETVQSLPRTKIVTTRKNYLHAEFRSQWIGFIDDVEFYVPDAGGVIHFRSASRTGYSDLGVNRKRMERIVDRLSR